jgi:hypothetical protein
MGTKPVVQIAISQNQRERTANYFREFLQISQSNFDANLMRYLPGISLLICCLWFFVKHLA